MNQKARDKRARPQVSILNTAMQVEQSFFSGEERDGKAWTRTYKSEDLPLKRPVWLKRWQGFFVVQRTIGLLNCHMDLKELWRHY